MAKINGANQNLKINPLLALGLSAVSVIGVAAFLITLKQNPKLAWAGYLLSFWYVLALAMMATWDPRPLARDLPRLAAPLHLAYVLRLADTSLILAQRLGEWIGHAPALEEDLGLGNLALDFLGQARLLLTHAGSIEGAGRSEDDLAFFRSEGEYRNLTLVEQPNGDFAQSIVRQFFIDAWQVPLFEGLQSSADAQLAAIAAKSLKEALYHRRFSSHWLVRMGDGTEESHRRAQSAIDELWSFTGEMFAVDDSEHGLRLDDEHALACRPALAGPQGEGGTEHRGQRQADDGVADFLHRAALQQRRRLVGERRILGLGDFRRLRRMHARAGNVETDPQDQHAGQARRKGLPEGRAPICHDATSIWPGRSGRSGPSLRTLRTLRHGRALNRCSTALIVSAT